MKILVLILSCHNPIYKINIEQGIPKTWNSISHPNIDVCFYYGGAKETFQKDQNIYVTSGDGFFETPQKTIECFKYCLDNMNFSYIYRTNLSSYVHKKNLYDYLLEQPRTNFYGGSHVLHAYRRSPIRIFRGNEIILSRDLVEYIAHSTEKIHTRKNGKTEVDDQHIGRLMYAARASRFLQIKFQDFYHNTLTPPDPSFYDTVNPHMINFRCKNRYNRYFDSLTMKAIHERIYPETEVNLNMEMYNKQDFLAGRKAIVTARRARIARREAKRDKKARIASRRKAKRAKKARRARREAKRAKK